MIDTVAPSFLFLDSRAAPIVAELYYLLGNFNSAGCDVVRRIFFEFKFADLGLRVFPNKL